MAQSVCFRSCSGVVGGIHSRKDDHSGLQPCAVAGGEPLKTNVEGHVESRSFGWSLPTGTGAMCNSAVRSLAAS